MSLEKTLRIETRTGWTTKGDRLTSAEVDKNFLALEDDIDTVADMIPTAVAVTGTSTLTDEQCHQTMVTNYGMSTSGNTTLPATTYRTRFSLFVEEAAKDWKLVPPTDEAFLMNGVALTVNQQIQIGDSLGDCASLIRLRTGASTYQWAFYTGVGMHEAYVA